MAPAVSISRKWLPSLSHPSSPFEVALIWILCFTGYIGLMWFVMYILMLVPLVAYRREAPFYRKTLIKSCWTLLSVIGLTFAIFFFVTSTAGASREATAAYFNFCHSVKVGAIAF